MFDTKKALAILAAASLLMVAGCGGSSESPAETTARASARTSRTTPLASAAPDGSPEFVKQAWAVCADINGQLARFPRLMLDEGRGPQTARIIALRREAEKQFGEVEAPADVARDYRRFVTLVGEQTDTMVDLRRAGFERDRRASVAASLASQRINEQQNALARDLGIDGCAGG